jgi:plasmid stabilization system protein ParE
MALQIVWSPSSIEQLNEILIYWAKRNGSLHFSQKLYQRVKKTLKILALHPESGKLTEIPHIRAKIILHYILFYAYNDDTLNVVGFCDMRRDPDYINTLMV